MPQLNSFSWVLWIVVIVSQPVVVFLMVKSGAWRRWTSMFAFVCLLSLQSFALLYVSVALPDTDFRALLYFWIYWSLALVCEAIQIWMIVQIACDLIGISKRAKLWIRHGVPALAMANLIWAAILAVQSEHQFYSRVVYVVSWLDRSITLSWLTTFLIIALGSNFLGIEWTAEARGVGLGFALDSLSSTVASWLGYGSINFTFLSNLKAVIYLLALWLWGGITTAKPGRENLPSPERAHMYVKISSELVKNLKGRRP
jgi:hypothetical protein